MSIDPRYCEHRKPWYTCCIPPDDPRNRRIAELEVENARLRDTIIYAKGRMKAYGIVDARIDLPGGWNEK